MNRRTQRHCHVIALGVLIVAAFNARAQEPRRGRILFTANGCYQCHGYEGQGGAAPRIAPTPYPYEVFDRLVRHPPNVMPAYAADVLSDADLRAIYSYVASIAEPLPISGIDILR